MQDPSTTVREQVKKLLKARGDLSQKAFAERISRDESWVSHFLKGTRPATDLELVVRIARVLSVSVGYLLNEVDRGLDAEAAVLLGAFRSLQEETDRRAVLQLALNLKERHGDETGGAGSDARGDAARAAGGSNQTKGSKPLSRKRR